MMAVVVARSVPDVAREGLRQLFARVLVHEVDEIVQKLRVLADAGVDQFNVYLMNGDEREQLEKIGREVIPAMAGAVSRG